VESAVAKGAAEQREAATKTAREAAPAEFDRRLGELTMTALRLKEGDDTATLQRFPRDGGRYPIQRRPPLRPWKPRRRLHRDAAPSRRTPRSIRKA